MRPVHCHPRAGLLAAFMASAAFCSAAQTPSPTPSTTPGSVELYGLVDAGAEYIDNGAVSVKRLSSGISTGSRWGLRGNEDLGGGWRALFTLESRLELDTGATSNRGPVYVCGTPASCPGVALFGPVTALPAPTQAQLLGGVNAVNDALLNAVSTVNGGNALFDRQAYVGLVTPVGAVLLGRQYTPGYEVFVKYNSFADGFAGSPAQLAQINIRANNALQYRIDVNGVIASAMYGLGGAELNRNERGAPNRGDDFMGANLQYNTADFGVGLAYNRNNTVTYAAPTQSRKGLETLVLGANGNAGPVKLFAALSRARNQNPVLAPADILGLVAAPGATLASINTTLSGLYINRFDVDGLRGMAGPVDLKLMHLGLQWTLGAGTLHLAYNRAKDTARSPWATADARVDQVGAAYVYSLSRRTQLYGAAALANNKGQARTGQGGAGYLGGLTTAPGVDSRVVQLGVRHAF